MEKIEIWSKPAFHGISNHEHLFVVYTNSVGAQFYIRGGPAYIIGNGQAGGGFVLGNIVTEYGEYAHDTVDWIPLEDRDAYPSVIVCTSSRLITSCLRSIGLVTLGAPSVGILSVSSPPIGNVSCRDTPIPAMTPTGS